jgi:hypothetical protein
LKKEAKKEGNKEEEQREKEERMLRQSETIEPTAGLPPYTYKTLSCFRSLDGQFHVINCLNLSRKCVQIFKKWLHTAGHSCGFHHSVMPLFERRETFFNIEYGHADQRIYFFILSHGPLTDLQLYRSKIGGGGGGKSVI